MHRRSAPPMLALAAALAAAAAGAGGALAGCDTIGEAEAHCVEAVARLEDCCPSFEAALLGFTCESSGSDTPAVGRDEAACIQAASCETLRSSLVCARAAVLFTGGPWPVGAPQGLCP